MSEEKKKDLTPEEEARILSLISGIDSSKKKALPAAQTSASDPFANDSTTTLPNNQETEPASADSFPSQPAPPTNKLPTEPDPFLENSTVSPAPFPSEPAPLQETPGPAPFPAEPAPLQETPEPAPFPSEPTSPQENPEPAPFTSEPPSFPSEPTSPQETPEPAPFPAEPAPFPSEPAPLQENPGPAPFTSEPPSFPAEPTPLSENPVSEPAPFPTEPAPFPTEPAPLSENPVSEPAPFPAEPTPLSGDAVGSAELNPDVNEPLPFPSNQASQHYPPPVSEPISDQAAQFDPGNPLPPQERALGDDLRASGDDFANMTPPPFPPPESGSQAPESPELGSSDYQPAYEMPAYQPSLGEEAVTVEIGDLPAAEDIIFMIAQVDPELEKAASDGQMLTKIRSEAAGAGSKKGRGRPKLNPLPFDMLTKGTPLVATVYSPSGGVGKSSTAMNLAAYIAAVGQTMVKQNKKDANARPPRVLVLDGDIVQGSLALRLTGELRPSIHTLQLYIDERTDQGFTGEQAWPKYYSQEGNPPLSPGEKTMLDFVHWHKSLPNLNLLAAPERPELFWDFGSEEYRFILRMLAKFYDVIIIDTGTDLVLDSQRSWLAHANEVFLVTAPENDRLYNASKAVDYMIHEQPNPQDNSENPRMEPPLVAPDKLSVVMTRYDMESGLDSVKIIDEIFPWLDSGQKFFVPDFSKEIIITNNLGEFLSLTNAKYAQSIDQLAQKIFQRYIAAKHQRGIPSAT